MASNMYLITLSNKIVLTLKKQNIMERGTVAKSGPKKIEVSMLRVMKQL